ncbi:carbohydrate ABC transporter permease [Actinophytocola oryzae]|uniref:Carbohydrate ABC transporter membrane protein 1 (CUT1 family) n=1 Tax=Actinophytocola oryzae TaxID=502181 RepID=A0A4R7US43_9PSEU|nr:sugar ABC transporter permease [Actinophytocola oryzae]TDV38568.1 carbohydrate ABC transporter membrane protein 1 (CUT1 family) [Actinophytocola oryzae]
MSSAVLTRKTTKPPTRPRDGRAGLAVPRATTAAYLFLAVGLVAVVLLVPMGVTVWRSLFGDTAAAEFAGVDGYRNIYADEVLARSLLNTLIWVVGSLLLPVGVGLAVAVLTSTARWGRVAQFAVVLPYALSGSAVAVIGSFLLRTDGAVNSALGGLGLDGWRQSWLLEWPLNTISAILVNTWQSTGVAVILFLVGLRAVPPDTLEAAALDGAVGWRRFWYVTFPQLRAATAVVVGITLANALRAFDVVWVLTAGGPARSSETLALSMYRETFLLNNPGTGAALAVVLTVIVLLSSWIYLRSQLRSPR